MIVIGRTTIIRTSQVERIKKVLKIILGKSEAMPMHLCGAVYFESAKPFLDCISRERSDWMSMGS